MARGPLFRTPSMADVKPPYRGYKYATRAEAKAANRAQNRAWQLLYRGPHAPGRRAEKRARSHEQPVTVPSSSVRAVSRLAYVPPAGSIALGFFAHARLRDHSTEPRGLASVSNETGR